MIKKNIKVTINTKNCNKIRSRDRNNINLKLCKNNIYEELLSRNKACNRDISF